MNNDFKPYESYKESSLPWVVQLPSHWEIKRAKAMFCKMNRPVRDFDEVVTCFRDGTVTLRKNRRTTGFTESLKEIGYQGIRKGDLVIHVMDAFAGAIGVSDSDGKGTPVYSVCTPKEPLNNYYYAHVLREMAKIGFIQSLYRGIRERSSDFRFEMFANQHLPVPPLVEQDKIVRYLDVQLDKINKFIRTKKKNIAVLKEKKQAIINQAVTKGLNPSAKMKPSGINWVKEIPENWSRDKVSRLFGHIGSGTTPSSGDLRYYNGDINWINSGDLNDGLLFETNKKVTEQALSDYSVLKVYPKNTIIIALYGATIGKLAISQVEACCNQACCALGSIRENINLEYAFYTLFSCRNYLIEQSKGGGQPNISQDIVKQTWIPIPPINEQKLIVSYIKQKVEDIDKSLTTIEKEISLMVEYRNSLVSDVVTGKIDIRNIPIDRVYEDDIELQIDDFVDENETEEVEDLEEVDV